MNKPCKRCDKLNHKIKCLLIELGLHKEKHNYLGKNRITKENFDEKWKEMMEGKTTWKINLCTNCGQAIEKIGVMMPTANPKHRMMCTSCADKVLKLDRKVKI